MIDYDIDINDVVLLNDGDLHVVTGVVHNDRVVYFYQGGNEVKVSFDSIDTLYKQETHKRMGQRI